MKTNNIIRLMIVMVLCIILLCVSSCQNRKTVRLDVQKIRKISEVSTIKCKTHAYLETSPEKSGWLEKVFTGIKAYRFLAEYDGEFSVGIDFVGLELDKESGEVVVEITRPHLLDLNIDNHTLADYPVQAYSQDEILLANKKLGINEYNNLLVDAQKELQEYVEENRLNYDAAEENAKQLIANYINQIAKLNDTEYHITFQYAEEADS